MSKSKDLVLEEHLLTFEQGDLLNPPKIIKTDFFCNGRFRWNLLINIGVIGMVALPFFVPTYITLGVNCYYAFFWFIFICFAIRTQVKIAKRMKQKDSTQEQNSGKYKSIMATFVYREPLELILKTLKNISEQSLAKEIIMSVCMEEKTPDREEKIKQIFDQYKESFGQLIVTVHPYGVEGEIPGKCSNNNFAIRSIYNHLRTENPDFDPKEYFVTDFDVDTIFHQRFSDIQRQTVLGEKDKHSVVWQPILFYNWDLDKLSFFTRITGVVRNILMMGALIPFNINIMSVYTASLQLYIDGDFCHPAYQMEDIICYIRWMTLTKRTLDIKPIYCPTISGPTSGKNIFSEFYEWARQIRRWSVGMAEVFHYFCVKARRINFFKSLLWGFNYLNYYVGFTCIQVLLMISTSVAVALKPKDELKMFFVVPLGVVYLCMLAAIIINKLAVKYLLKTITDEKIPFYRDIIHWILSPFVMLAYGLVVCYGFFEIVVFGREVCKHSAARKSVLGARDRLFSYRSNRVNSAGSQLSQAAQEPKESERRYVDVPPVISSHTYEYDTSNNVSHLDRNAASL